MLACPWTPTSGKVKHFIMYAFHLLDPFADANIEMNDYISSTCPCLLMSDMHITAHMCILCRLEVTQLLKDNTAGQRQPALG